MKYAENIDYLVSSIIYLGTHNYYWARTSTGLAKELSLDEDRLVRVLEGFPGIFRRSQSTTENGKPYFTLQARYAQRSGPNDGTGGTDGVQMVEPVDNSKLDLILKFVLQMADKEVMNSRGRTANIISIVAVCVSAIAIMVAAYMNSAAKNAPTMNTPVVKYDTPPK